MSISTTRRHSSTLDAKAAAHLARWKTRGYASTASALRVAQVRDILAAIEADGLAAHFAFVDIREGKHAGRVALSLGFEARASVPPEAIRFAHYGVLIVSAD